MKHALYFLLLFLLPTFFACNQPDPAAVAKAQEIAGKYMGTTPCADCEGIDYALTLNADFTYTAAMTYLGKTNEPKTSNGKWILDGNTVKLREKSEGMDWFDIGENQLVMLDLNGAKVTGNLADKYILWKEGFAPKAVEGPAARFAAKREAGLDFLAMGTEPFWALDMDYDKNFTFYGVDIDTISAPAVPGSAKPDGTVEYKLTAGKTNMTVVISKTTCSDGMSDNQYDYTVTVTVDGKTYNGCGVMLGSSMGSLWKLKTINGAAPAAADFTMATPFLQIRAGENLYFGSDGCNSIRGKATLEDGGKIKFLPGPTTLMACPGNGPKTYTAALFSVDGYKMENDELHLTAGGKTVLTYGL